MQLVRRYQLELLPGLLVVITFLIGQNRGVFGVSVLVVDAVRVVVCVALAYGWLRVRRMCPPVTAALWLITATFCFVTLVLTMVGRYLVPSIVSTNSFLING